MSMMSSTVGGALGMMSSTVVGSPNSHSISDSHTFEGAREQLVATCRHRQAGRQAGR